MIHLTFLSKLRNTTGTVCVPGDHCKPVTAGKTDTKFLLRNQVYSGITDGFHTCAVTPAFLAENFGLGAVNKEDEVVSGLEKAE